MKTTRNLPNRSLVMLLAGAILVTAIPMAAGFVQTRRLAHLIVDGEVSRWRDTVHDALRTAPPPPGDALLAGIVAANTDRGLRFVAVVTPDGDPIASAGVPSRSLPSCRADRRELFVSGERVRVCDGPLPHRPHGGPPPRGPGAVPPPPAPPSLVLEFVPYAARDLERAQTGLVTAGAVALLAMLGLGLLALRLMGEREAIARRLAESRHLSSLGEMSAVLAHEIRNPLASLKGHAQLVAEGASSDVKLAPRAERVVREATRLERLVDELLTFARTGSLELRAVQLGPWIRGVVAAIDPRAVEVIDEGAPARWPIDPARLGEALANVIRNGLEAESPERSVTVQLSTDDSQLVIEVRDRGPGIARGEEDSIFEPFHTRKVRGTGLGLAIARRAVALHGGTITARNHPGGGAVFRITLPEG